MARSQPYGFPLCPRAMATSQATIRATIRASPAAAVACRSIRANRSSRPSPRSPRTVTLRPATRTTRPNAASLERVMARLRSLVIEHLLDRDPEKPGEREGERQRRGVALVLDRVDGLARHSHRLRQLALGQVLLNPQRTHLVLHLLPVLRAGHDRTADLLL